MASIARATAARGRGVRPPSTGDATRRDFSAAVAAWRSDGRASAGEREKEPARWAGPSEARHARGRLAGPASVDGPEARRRPVKEK